MKYNHKINGAAIKAYLYRQWCKCDDGTIAIFAYICDLSHWFGLHWMYMHKTRIFANRKINKQLLLELVVANICGRRIYADRQTYVHGLMCVLYVQNIWILFYMCDAIQCNGGIAHSFARSIASLVHAHRHTYGDFIYVYATLLPSAYNHIYNAIIIFSRLSLSHNNQCNYSTQNNQKQKFSPLETRTKK